MPTIRLYKSKLDPANRMGSVSEYDAYLNSLTSYEIDIKKPFIEKSPSLYVKYFEDPIANKEYSLFNYALIDATGGEIVPAFVRLVPLATEGYRVDVKVDYWAKYLRFNRTGNVIDLHGKCVRAHVNDWEEYDDTTQVFHKPTLRNTYLTRESDYTLYSQKYVDMPYIGSGELEDIVNSRYIYLYLQNPTSSLTDMYAVKQSYKSPYFEGNIMSSPTMGLVVCGVISSNGNCYFNAQFNDGGLMVNTPSESGIHINGLTSEQITTMFISEIPPVDGAQIKKVNYDGGSYYIIDLTNSSVTINDIYGLEGTATSTGGGFPKQFFLFKNLDMRKKLYISDYNEPYANITKDSAYSIYDIEGLYVKPQSFVYQPLTYMGEVIDTINTEYIQVSLTPDGSNYIAVFSNPNMGKSNATKILQNTKQFAPDTVRDYWTTLNGRMAANSATEKEINLTTNFLRSTVNAGSQLIRAGADYGTSETFDAGGLLGSAIDLAENIGLMPIRRENNEYSMQLALKQIADGITKSYSPVYYGNCLLEQELSISKILPDDASIVYVERDIERFGYNTFLLLEDVLINHKRKLFNYIQTSQVEVHGCDADLAQDIVSMFQNGVHLWHTIYVGDYDGANYQVNV